jgi:hypothetical protein
MKTKQQTTKRKPTSYRWLIRALRSPEIRAEYDEGRLRLPSRKGKSRND